MRMWRRRYKFSGMTTIGMLRYLAISYFCWISSYLLLLLEIKLSLTLTKVLVIVPFTEDYSTVYVLCIPCRPMYNFRFSKQTPIEKSYNDSRKKWAWHNGVWLRGIMHKAESEVFSLFYCYCRCYQGLPEVGSGLRLGAARGHPHHVS